MYTHHSHLNLHLCASHMNPGTHTTVRFKHNKHTQTRGRGTQGNGLKDWTQQQLCMNDIPWTATDLKGQTLGIWDDVYTIAHTILPGLERTVCRTTIQAVTKTFKRSPQAGTSLHANNYMPITCQ